MFNIFSKKQEINFNKVYDASIQDVWNAWTNPENLKKWWGPKGTFVPECRIDPKVGGELYIVMEADESMGSYKGTRWPLQGNFTILEPNTKFAYTAKSWTQGQEEKSTIDQEGVLLLTEENGQTKMHLKVTINKAGPSAMLAKFGMQMGYNSQFEKLAEFLKK